MNQHAWVELLDLKLVTQIGSYGPNDTKPDHHLLDLILKIDARQVLIEHDRMSDVFDYDPLIVDIETLAADGLYETQERLMTRIACTCVHYPEIKAIEMKLRKTPVRSDHGSLGIRLSLDEIATSALRSNAVLEN